MKELCIVRKKIRKINKKKNNGEMYEEMDIIFRTHIQGKRK